MQSGFSFCGVDIAKFGLEYVPTLDQTYVFAGSQYEISQESFESHNGGYFYGTTVKPKEFRLRCVFQGNHISHGILSNIESFFRRGRTGRLVFKNRDWVWYTATVVDVDVNNLLNVQNGFVTISLTAFYPFARCDFISLTEETMMKSHVTGNSGLLDDTITPNNKFEKIEENTSILLYNGGTEKACVAIEIAGDAGEGVTIKNNTTHQECKMVAFDREKTTDDSKYLICDSLNGKTILTNGVNSERAFVFHDHGFIELAPSFPISRNVYVSYQEGSNEVQTVGFIIDEDLTGRYVMINNSWKKIISSKDESAFVIDSAAEKTGAEYTDIVLMNEITVELGAGASLDKLNFIYKPTFA